jgi:hypothetical protein
LGIFFNNKENKKNDNESPKKVKRNPSYLVFDWNIDVHVVTVNWSINQPEENIEHQHTKLYTSTGIAPTSFEHFTPSGPN